VDAPVAHIAGMPVEEALAALLPAATMAGAFLAVQLRAALARRRR
jgi:hypothetical protein